MAVLRIAQPGQPVRLVDLGAAYGRATGTVRRSSINGELVVGESQRQRDLRLAREAMARLRGEYVTTEARRAQMAAQKKQARERKKFSIHPENRT